MNSSANPTDAAIDPQRIAQIVRAVVQRLKQTTNEPPTQHDPTRVQLDQKIISTQTIESLPNTVTEIQLAPRCLVTPAAKDEAKKRAIQITSVSTPTPQDSSKQLANPSPINTPWLTDRDDEQRRSSIVQQLTRRGITRAPAVTVVCSNSPARETYQQCASGQRAVMIRTLHDVTRFQAELAPQVWVIDMTELNLIAAVNAIAAIHRNTP